MIKKKKSGFTLLELLAVIIIIGILASMALPSYGRTIEIAKVRDARAVLDTIYHAERLYRLDQTASPTNPQNPYGTLNDLINAGYLTNPDAGNSNRDWNFAVTVGPGAAPPFTTFIAIATRTGGANNGNTITIDQSFIGSYGPPPSDPAGGPPHPDRNR